MSWTWLNVYFSVECLILPLALKYEMGALVLTTRICVTMEPTNLFKQLQDYIKLTRLDLRSRSASLIISSSSKFQSIGKDSRLSCSFTAPTE